MEPGSKKKPPPPPPPRAARPAAGAAPSTEGIMANAHGVPAQLVARLRLLLPPAHRDSLAFDVTGRILISGAQIGVQEKDRLLLDYGQIFSHIALPGAMRNVAQAGGMIIFIEVTESAAHICAGNKLGQKNLYSRLG